MNRLRPALVLGILVVSWGLVATTARADCPTILVGPVSLPDGVTNTPYTQPLTQTGASGPTFSITSGALPTGLAMNASGNITGTPTAAGTFTFAGTASDVAGCTGGRTYRVAITCPPITVDPTSMPNGFVGVPYPTQTLVGSGGAAPYVFTVTTGALPAGLSQSGTGGQTISGTPTGPAGPFGFTITGTDANSCTGTRSYSGSICGTITVTPPATGQGTVGTSFSQQFTQTGAGSPTFTIDPTSPNTLPPGWTLAPATGILSNPNPAGGTFTIKVRVTDSSGCFGVSANYVVTISPVATSETYAPVVVGNMSIDTATGTVFSVLTNDTPGSTANLLGGGLSAQGGDVVLNSATGTFTYNPKRGYEGADSFDYTVTNGGQTSTTATLSLTVGGMVWFVNNSAGACVAADCGRRSSPYDTLAAFQTANTTGAALDPRAGDRVFLYQSATSYTGPAGVSIVLRNTQRLIGQDDAAAVTFGVATGYTVPDTTQAVPVMDPNPPSTTILGVAGQNVVTLAQDNVIRALTINAANNAAIAAGAVNVGTVGSINNVTMTGAGGAIQLGAHTGTLNVTSSSITGTGAATAVSVVGASAGSAAFTNTIVNRTGGTLLSVQNRTGSGSVTFTGGSLTLAGGADGIVLAANSATTTITLSPGFALTTTTGRGLVTNAPGVLTIGGTASTINATGGAALDLTATNLTSGTFATVSAATGAGPGINLNNLSGTLAIGSTAITMNAGGTQGINVSGSSANITFASGGGTTQVSGAGGTQRILVGTSTGTINFGNTTLNGGTDAISLQNNSGGSRAFGTLTIGNTTAPTGTGFLHAVGGGSTTVGPATVTAATGIDIEGNATAVTFSGTTTVTASSGAGVNIQGNTAAGNETFSTLSVTKTGAGSAVTIGNTTANNGSSTVNLGALSASAANGTAILTGPTPLTTSGSGVVSATNGPAINATGTAFSATFGSVSSATSGTQGITLGTSTGTLTMNGGTITGAAGVPFVVSGGTLSATYGGAITHLAGNANALVSVSGGHATGTITLQAGANSATSGAGLVFAGANGSYVFSGTTSLNGSVNGVTIGTSTGTFNFGSGVSVQNTTGTAVQINGTQPVVLFSGPITQTTAQRAVLVTGVTGGSTGGIASPFSIRFAGNVTKSTNAATAIDLNNNTGGSVGFTGSQNYNTATADAINYGFPPVNGNGFSVTFSGATVATTSGRGLRIVGNGSGGGSVTFGGSIATGTGGGVEATAWGGALTLNGASVTTGAGTGVSSDGGSFGSTGSSISSAGRALVLNGVALAAGSTMTGVGSTAGTNGISLTNVTGNGLVIGNGGSLSGNSGSALVVSGGSASLSYAGSITQNTAGQRTVDITGASGGTISLSGAIGSGAVFLNGNAGATINFTGGLAISTGANAAFTATGGGTVSATQNNTSIVNTLTATTGTALNVTATSIGAAGLTFRSITANGSTNNTGIILDGTGTTAGLTVTGNGSASSGGTISSKTGGNTTTYNTTDGRITVNAGTPIGIGIFLRSTRNVSLARMQLNDFSNYAIFGTSVTNFTLDDSTVNGTSGNTVNASAATPPEGSVFFQDLVGNAAITNSTVTNLMPQNSTRITDTIQVMNNGGTLSLLNIDNCTIANITQATNPGGKDAIFFGTPAGLGSGTMNLTINNTNVTAAFQFVLQVNVQGSVTSNVTITNSHFTDTNENIPNGIASAGGGINLTGGGSDVYVKYLIQNNTFQHNSGVNPGAINAGALLITGIASNTGTFDGRIINNTFGVTGVPRSGAGNGADALRLFASGNNGSHGNTKVLVQGNSIKRWGETGIQFNARQGNARIDATVLGNTINEPGTAALGAFGAIWVNSGALPPDTNQVNIAIGGTAAADKNTMQDSDPSNATDVFLDKNSCGGCASTLNLYRNGSAAGGAGEALIRQILVDDNVATLDLLAGFTNGSTIGTVAGLPPQPTP